MIAVKFLSTVITKHYIIAVYFTALVTVDTRVRCGSTRTAGAPNKS